MAIFRTSTDAEIAAAVRENGKKGGRPARLVAEPSVNVTSQSKVRKQG